MERNGGEMKKRQEKMKWGKRRDQTGERKRGEEGKRGVEMKAERIRVIVPSTAN